MDQRKHLTPAARAVLMLLLAVYGFVIMRDPGHFRLLDNVDLAVHEAGHVFFGPFGEFIGFLGGTLFQLIVPIAFFVYFLRRGDRFAASVVLWWVAQNFWNISVYVKDARALALPLVGGGEHDWAYLLGELGLLRREQGIGQAFFAVGLVLFFLSVAWGLMNVRSTAAKVSSSKTTDAERPRRVLRMR